MFYPANNHTRPHAPQARIDSLSDSLTRGLQAIQERERNHDALVSQAKSILPTLRPSFVNLTSADIDAILQ